MGRHIYRGKNIKFIKVTVELEEELYEKLMDIKCDYFDRRSFKEIINNSLREYLRK